MPMPGKQLTRFITKWLAALTQVLLLTWRHPTPNNFIDLCNNEIKQIKALKAWRRSMRTGKKTPRSGEKAGEGGIGQ